MKVTYGVRPLPMPKRPKLTFSGKTGRISGRRHGSDTTPTPDPGLTAYPLDDDGTAAAVFGNGALATSAPSYLQAEYTYESPASPAIRAALPSAATYLGTQAIEVSAGTVLACEMEIVAAPAGGSYDEIELLAVTSSGGTPAGGYRFGISAEGGGTPKFSDNGSETATDIVASATGFRIGLVVDGDTGDVTAVSTDGSYGVITTFTPGQSVTFGMVISDATAAAAAQTATVRLVPAAADMALTYPAGAVDVFGDTI